MCAVATCCRASPSGTELSLLESLDLLLAGASEVDGETTSGEARRPPTPPKPTLLSTPPAGTDRIGGGAGLWMDRFLSSNWTSAICENNVGKAEILVKKKLLCQFYRMFK